MLLRDCDAITTAVVRIFRGKSEYNFVALINRYGDAREPVVKYKNRLFIAQDIDQDVKPPLGSKSKRSE